MCTQPGHPSAGSAAVSCTAAVCRLKTKVEVPRRNLANNSGGGGGGTKSTPVIRNTDASILKKIWKECKLKGGGRRYGKEKNGGSIVREARAHPGLQHEGRKEGRRVPLFCDPQNAGFSFLFLSFHHPNNGFENILIFYLAFFNAVAKKLFLGRKHIGGICTPYTPPPPQSYACGTVCYFTRVKPSCPS
jgi:hypothetical protein